MRKDSEKPPDPTLHMYIQKLKIYIEIVDLILNLEDLLQTIL